MKNGIKVTIVGDAGVGKSSIIERLAHDRFFPERSSTIGAAFFCYLYKNQRFNIWDSAGEERYSSLIPLYIKDAKIILMVYDVTNEQSFNRIQNYWVPFINDHLGINDDPIYILVGNKIDLESNRKILQWKGENLSLKLNCKFLEVSAQSGVEINKIFQLIDKKTKF